MATAKPTTKPKPSRNGAPEPEVLTLAEAAAFLRTDEAAVRMELEAGRLGGRKLAGEWRIGRTAILSWLATPAPPAIAFPATDESPEEQEAFLKRLAEIRKEWGAAS